MLVVACGREGHTRNFSPEAPAGRQDEISSPLVHLASLLRHQIYMVRLLLARARGAPRMDPDVERLCLASRVFFDRRLLELRRENEGLKGEISRLNDALFWSSFSIRGSLRSLNEKLLCVCTGCQEAGRIFAGVDYGNLPVECRVRAEVVRAARATGARVFSVACGPATTGPIPTDLLAEEESDAHLLAIGSCFHFGRRFVSRMDVELARALQRELAEC